ncbi:uncharacterized protein LOC129599827 [Paramacrobiotus metropolitanus]|uniref:uncharacterized protein LOC129599827 n=1 Tax=Paramacrobiotus metropolitanus TaxID=2943436 RepID=UPI0024461FC8|nr:uncharacterized protein LOC129599827 [Paramacrobiotus metropolitanus]
MGRIPLSKAKLNLTIAGATVSKQLAAIPDERLLGYGLSGIGGYGTYALDGLGGYGGLGTYRGLDYGGLGTVGYGGLGGYGSGGLGYGRGGLIYDEDLSAENDEFPDEAMTSKGDYKTVIIPGHKIRKLKMKLYKKHGEESAIDHATTITGNSNMETMPTENKSGNENIYVIRVSPSYLPPSHASDA